MNEVKVKETKESDPELKLPECPADLVDYLNKLKEKELKDGAPEASSVIKRNKSEVETYKASAKNKKNVKSVKAELKGNTTETTSNVGLRSCITKRVVSQYSR